MEWLKAMIIAGAGVTFFCLGWIFPAGMMAGWLAFWLVANARAQIG